MDLVVGVLSNLFLPKKPDPPPSPPPPLSDAEYKAKADAEKRKHNAEMAAYCKTPLSLCPNGYQEVEVYAPTKKIGNMYYVDSTSEKKKYCWNDGAFCSLDSDVYGDEWGSEDGSGRILVKRNCSDGVPTGMTCEDIKLPECEADGGPPELHSQCKSKRLGYESQYCDIVSRKIDPNMETCESLSGDKTRCKAVRVDINTNGNAVPEKGDMLTQEWTSIKNSCKVLSYTPTAGKENHGIVMCEKKLGESIVSSTGTVKNATKNVSYTITQTYGTAGRCHYDDKTGDCTSKLQKTILSMSNYRAALRGSERERQGLLLYGEDGSEVRNGGLQD